MTDRNQPPAKPGKKGLSTGAIVAIVLGILGVAGLCVIGILAALLMPALAKAKHRANEAQCANNLRQIALASIQYADDKRFFPYVPDDKSGKETVELLFRFNYLDDRTTLHCPEDESAPDELSYEGFVARWSMTAMSNTPLAWDKKPHADGRRNVVCVDGHTQWMTDDELQQAIEQAKARLKPR
jgi:type II secretory pathway pseudopilin PulG